MLINPVDARSLLRRLSEWPPSELPVVSAYLDLRPEATGQNPQVRSGQIILRDRLREEERGVEPHTPAGESLAADIERITRHVEEQALPEAQGAAIFASHGDDRFEAVEVGIGLENAVTVGPLPVLLPLARLADDDLALIALADSNTLRLFTAGVGRVEEAGLLDEEPDNRHAQGGWSQARFQRHVDEHRSQFAELAAEAIEEVVRQQDVRHVVLIGDEVAIPVLREQLAQATSELVRGVLHMDIRASLDDIAAEALPFLEIVRTDENRDAADRLVGAALGDAMGVGGVDDTRSAVQLGQALEVVVDGAADIADDVLEDMIRGAALTDARVRFVDDHAGLRELGGVGALLRFRLDRAANQPVDESAAEGQSERAGATL